MDERCSSNANNAIDKLETGIDLSILTCLQCRDLFGHYPQGCKVRQSGLAQKVAFPTLTGMVEKFYQQLTDFLGKAGGDGFDLIHALREIEAGRKDQIPAIALTAYAGEEDRQRALAEGFQMHITKPVRLNELASAVIKLVAVTE